MPGFVHSPATVDDLKVFVLPKTFRRRHDELAVIPGHRPGGVLERLSDLFVHRGVPEHIRSDNGSEFTAKCVREWLGRVGVKTLFIEPGSPWENGYVESFFRLAPGRAAGAGSVRHAA